MKKLLLLLMVTSTTLLSTTGFTAGFKVCLFHDIEYAYIHQFSTCPWNSNNLPPNIDEDFPPGPHHHTNTASMNSGKNKNFNILLTEIVHSDECFGEHNGGMN